jgi:DNA primase
MSRLISQSFIHELLTRIDIIDVIESRITLKRTGKNYSACCPFHTEKTPSFSVNPEKQFFYCFGCTMGGNALTFIMEYEGLSFIPAIEELAQSIALSIEYEHSVSSHSNYDAHDQLSNLLLLISDHYQHLLQQDEQGKKARQYLKKRGINVSIAKQYAMGYALKKWNNFDTFIDASNQEGFIDSGMMIRNEKGKTYNRFRDRIMFPIRNSRGKVIAFGGRVIDEGTPKYLNSPETILFHKRTSLYGLYEMKKAFRQINEILIVEGYMDVIALAQFGIGNAVATLGTATSIEHLQLLFKTASKIIFCFDGDRAGKSAALRALKIALPSLCALREIRFMFLPDNEDPDTFVRKIGADAFKQAMSYSITLFDFLMAHLTAKVDMNTFEGPVQFIHLAKEYGIEITDPLLSVRFNQKLAELSGLNVKQIQHLNQPKQSKTFYKKNKNSHTLHTPLSHSKQSFLKDKNEQYSENSFSLSTPSSHSSIKIIGEPLVIRSIILLLQNPSLLLSNKNQSFSDFIPLSKETTNGNKLLKEICIYIKKEKITTTGILMEKWRDQPEEKHLWVLAKQTLLLNKQEIEDEFIDLIFHFKKEMQLVEWDQLITLSQKRALTQNEKHQLQNLQNQIVR